MPYKIVPKDGQFCVVKKETEEVVKCHPTRPEAEEHMAALYANVDDAGDDKEGRRNAAVDLERIQKMHDLTVELGAACGEASATEQEMQQIIQFLGLNPSYARSINPALKPEDLAVKFVGDGRIQGYLVIFGNSDQPDLVGDYFTKDTDFWDEVLPKERPLTWAHAHDDATNGEPIIGQIVDMGADAIGKWYEAQMDKAHQYWAAIQKLIGAGVLGTSSDSAPQYVQREQRGKAFWLKRWPIFAAALTPEPCEPRMVDTVKFQKMGIQMPNPEEAEQQLRVLRLKASRYRIKK